jgi:aminoglycoside phosphotransferase (APT) family kinase protein
MPAPGADRPGAVPHELAAILAAAGLDPARAVGCARLDGGTYNTLHRVVLDDGNRLILKQPPPPGGPHLTYEADLLRNEVEYYRAAGRHTAGSVPRVVHCDLDGAAVPGGFLLMSECPGQTWAAAAAAPDAAEHRRLRRRLGSAVAELHTVTGPFFGYPSASVPTADSWREAFTAMLAAVLADADRFGCGLPVPVERVRSLIDAAAPALDGVRVPALVHFDLWQGNILLTGPPGERRLGALVDGERMFWGDPLAELVSLNLFGAPEDDPDLLAGYRAAGGRADLDEQARLRVALYRCYLYLIMLVEVVPRRYSPARSAETRLTAGPALTSALDLLATVTGAADPDWAAGGAGGSRPQRSWSGSGGQPV